MGADTSAPLLDVATGTGDVAADLRRLFPNAPITGIDISDGMMSVARRKMERMGLKGITFRHADCLALPFEDNTFGAVTVAYGVRNFADLQRGYSEMLRVLKPGGRLCVFELCVPRNPLLRFGYRLYTRSLLPLIGRIISRDSRAYSYLPQSVGLSAARRHDTAYDQRRLPKGRLQSAASQRYSHLHRFKTGLKTSGMIQYHQMLRHILQNGAVKTDRTARVLFLCSAIRTVMTSAKDSPS